MSQTITIYSTSDCAICRALMQWLDSKSIDYTKVIVDQVDGGIQDLMKVSGGAIGVPFTVIDRDGQVTKVSGFDRGSIQSALD